MSVNLLKLDSLIYELKPFGATLVAVSKTKPVNDILMVYNHGYKIFGENYVQELAAKQPLLPLDIDWHFIGHLQSNKVKTIAPFVNLIHGVESSNLAQEINKQALKFNRTIDILLQVHIAEEETKFGFKVHSDINKAKFLEDLRAISNLSNLKLEGIMTMPPYTRIPETSRNHFIKARKILDEITQISPERKLVELSMGSSQDYLIAIEEGSTWIRIGTKVFGDRS